MTARHNPAIIQAVGAQQSDCRKPGCSKAQIVRVDRVSQELITRDLLYQLKWAGVNPSLLVGLETE